MTRSSTRFALLLSCSLLALPAAAEIQDACFNCHGNDGASPYSDIPVIGGMSSNFIRDTLKSYKEAARYCPETEIKAGDKKGAKTTMCAIAKDMSADDIAKLAAYFSSKKFVRPAQSPDGALAAKGKEIHETYCEKCHSDGGSVADDDASMLAGQWMPYLTQQFKDFGSGKRLSPVKMKVKLDQLQPNDFDALVNYYGSFK